MAIPSRKQAQDFFNELDTSGDRTVSIQELAACLEAKGYSNESIADMFADIDKDSSKTITESEFLEEILKQPRQQALEKAFQEGDKDNSGYLDKSEVVALGGQGGLTDTETIEACFNAMDQDGSGKVDKNEFIAYMNDNY